jgi:hypothetical protein
MASGPVQAHDLQLRWTTRLAGPCGLPRTRRQDASTLLLQPTFRVTSTRCRHHLGRLLAERCRKPASVRCSASSGCVLDGTRAGFGPIDCHIARRALRGSAGAFSASSGSVDRDPLTPLVRRPAWNTASRIPLQSPDPRFAAGTSMAAASHGSRCLPSRETARSALARARRFALLRLAGRCICRASSSMCKTSTRPLVVRFRGRAEGHTRSCDFCRWMPPRARLWTARASRSAKLAGGTTAMLRPEVAFRPGQSPEVLEVRGRATDARHSRSRLRVPETSPQPRSLRAPRVAGAIPGRSGATR